MAIGFRPNSKGFGLEEVGVKLNERGFVEINEKMQTSVPSIYAIGDVTGKLMLAHVGSAMGIVAAENIAGAETVTLDYEMMPRATYSQPADRLLWPDRGAGEGARLHGQDRAIPLPGQRQGAGAGRLRRLGQDCARTRSTARSWART